MDNWFSFLVVFRLAVLVCGSVGATSSLHENNGGQPEADPLLTMNWEKEQRLANLINLDNAIDNPKVSPSRDPTRQPSRSTPPSQPPSETVIVASGIIIKQSDISKSTLSLIVGACCSVVMALTSICLYTRETVSQRKERAATPSVIEVPSGEYVSRAGVLVSPYSTEDGSDPDRGTRTLGHENKMGAQCYENNREMENVDLEYGHEGIDAVPNSASIVRRTQPSRSAVENDCLRSVFKENETPGYPRLRMPKLLYAAKMFQRSTEGENNKQIITWNQIREENQSPCSSGYAPTSLPSLMFSPFSVKGLSSILSPGIIIERGAPIKEPSVGRIANAEATTPQESPNNEHSANNEKGNGFDKSPMKEIVVKTEAPGEGNLSPIESSGSPRSESSSVRIFGAPRHSNEYDPGITSDGELNSGRKSEDGTFNFRSTFDDPENNLYEYLAPSGPLGIVVDTTPLGPRVRSINPLSSMFAEISPGDVIVGVDEVDTVGMEVGEFWKMVSRKANQQERILTILRI